MTYNTLYTLYITILYTCEKRRFSKPLFTVYNTGK